MKNDEYKSPFKFLDPYGINDREAFFGRDAEIRELYNLVTKNRLTFVYGPSGIGKTSLIQCGLAARFQGVDWLPIFVRRGADINASLRREIGKVLNPNEGPSFDGDLAGAIETLFNRYLRPVYLIFDQFEELFILGGDLDASKERLPFYETIADLLEADLPCRILFSMREDYFGHLVHFEKVVPELYNRKLRVEPMSRENVRSVITGSCRVYGIGFGDEHTDPDLILENMIAGRTGGHIPFAQVYLHMLYQEAARRSHTEEASTVCFDAATIDAVGPISDVLGRFLKDQELAIRRRLMKRGMNPPDEVVQQVLDVFVSEEGTKVPVSFHVGHDGAPVLQGKAARELARLPAALLSACLDDLEKSRILRRSEQDIEIAHDTLAALIDQQRSDEQRQRLEIRRRIETGYREYVDAGGTYFFDRGQLARIEPYLDKIAIEPDWHAFLNASREEVLRLEQVEIRAAREKLRRQRIFSAAITIVALLAIAAAGWAAVKQREAAEAHARAEENLIIAEREKAEAQTARDIARTNEQRAISAENDARQKADTLARTLFDLGKTTAQVVDALVADARRSIYHLEYVQAAGVLRTAAALGQPTTDLRRTLQEVAWFWNEAGQTEAAAQLLADAHLGDVSHNRKALQGILRQLDPVHLERLQKRYYPHFDMIAVTGGKFQMGSPEGVGEAHERPQHTVRISDFLLARTETTVWQYALYAASTEFSIDALAPAWGLDGDNPVVKISWYDAAQYANWLSGQFNLQPVYDIELIRGAGGRGGKITVNTHANGFRLPTEAEWEFAARGSGSTMKYAGNDDLKMIAWFNDNCDTGGVRRTRSVATRRPNALGLYDLSGNAWEWCQDWYSDRYYEAGRNTVTNDPEGPDAGVERVYRGGSWKLDAAYCRVTHRDFLYPGEAFDDFGFRLARRR